MDEQAHAMSHPDAAKATRGERRKLVEMALWYRDAWKAAQEESKRLSAELAARTEAWEAAEWKLRGELSDARADLEELEAECEQDGKEYEHAAKFIEAMGLVSTIHPTMQIDVLDPMGMAKQIVEYVERLRKGRDDEKVVAKVDVGDTGRSQGISNARPDDGVSKQRRQGCSEQGMSVEQSVLPASALWNAMGASLPANALDHRLGIPQPDGEPVAPMSARKPYRWGML